MKYFTNEYIFDHPWEKVSQAVFQKYPNPHKPEVKGTEVLDRRVLDGKLLTQRLITSQFGIPAWSRKLLGSDDICYGYEVSQVDPAKRELTMRTKNITFASACTLDERITYKPLPPTADHPTERTLFIQESRVTVHNIPFSGSLENIILSTMRLNSYKGPEAMEWVMHTKIDGENDVPLSHSSSTGSLILDNIEDITENARKSIDEISGRAIKSVDEFSGKAMKSVDELSGKAMKSVDELSGKAMKSVDEFGGMALKSVDELSGKALKSIDEISEKAAKTLQAHEISAARESIKTVENISETALRSYWWRFWW